MVSVERERVEHGIAQVLAHYGVAEDDASLVSKELVRAEAMGVTSHGVIRVKEYVEDILAGRTLPESDVRVVEHEGSLSVMDCGWSLGIVAGHRALTVAIEEARRTKIAAVVTRRCNHVNRLGAYPERAARLGFVCIAAVALPPKPHARVVPWGGAEVRLGTNPVAFGFPTLGDPIVADFSTAVIPEGRVRAALLNGMELPPDAAVDAAGRVTTDPAQYYGPPVGSLLPFGGPVGYKGYALSLLAELLGGALAGSSIGAEGRSVNGVFFCVLDPTGFLPASTCERFGQDVVDTMRTTPPAPGYDRVVVPGELEFEALAGAERGTTLELGEGVWKALLEVAHAAHVSLDGATIG